MLLKQDYNTEDNGDNEEKESIFYFPFFCPFLDRSIDRQTDNHKWDFLNIAMESTRKDWD